MGGQNREVSEWLDLSNGPQLTESKVVAINLRHAKGQMIKPYKKPKLFSSDGDLSAKWFVFYSYAHPKTGKFQRIKVYQDLNSFKTKKERYEYADLMITELTSMLENGYSPFRIGTEQLYGDVNTIAQAVPAFLKIKESLRGKTQMGYKSILTLFLTWAKRNNLDMVPLKELQRKDIKKYFEHELLQVRKLASTTHNTELTTIRSFFTFWQEEGKLTLNPAKGIKRLKEEVELHTIYNDQQIELITSHLKTSDTPRAKQLLQYLRFLYYTCIRPKELRMLKIGHIRLQTHTILIPSNASKSGRAEPVDISPGLAELIAEMKLEGLPADWYVFGNQAKGVAGDYSDPKPGPKPVGVNYFSKYYREILDELGVGEEHTLYAWKHTRNVHLWMQDKDLLRLMRHNRHTDPKVTMRYLRSLGLLVDTRIADERRI